MSGSFTRWCVLLIWKQPLAYTGGMGADFSGLKAGSIILGSLIPLGLHFGWKTGFLAIGFGLLSRYLFCSWQEKLGGITGDVLGMIIELVEIAVLLVF